jgi:hypothetical protein
MTINVSFDLAKYKMRIMGELPVIVVDTRIRVSQIRFGMTVMEIHRGEWI